MRTSETVGEVFKALSSFQDEVGVIPKDDDNPFFKSKYAGLPTVVEKATPILRTHGLVVVQTAGDGPSDGYAAYDRLTTRVHHLPSGEWFEDDAPLHLTPTGENQYLTAQAHGSALTYMRRYAYVTALGLICDVDDDGNAASLDTTSTRKVADNPKPKRTRRTRAQIEADNAGAATAEVDGHEAQAEVDEIPVPDGWEGDRDECVAAHNELAQRIAALKPEHKATCIEFRNTNGWPLTADKFIELGALTSMFEADVDAEVVV